MESPDFCEIPGIMVEFSNFFGEPQWVNNEVILCLRSSFRQFPYKNNKLPEFGWNPRNLDEIPGIWMKSPDFREIPEIMMKFSNFFGKSQWVNNEVGIPNFEFGVEFSY